MKSIFPNVHIRISHPRIYISLSVPWKKYVFFYHAFYIGTPRNNATEPFIYVSIHLLVVNGINSQMSSGSSSVILMKLFSHGRNKFDSKLSSAIRWPEMKFTLQEDTQTLGKRRESQRVKWPCKSVVSSPIVQMISLCSLQIGLSSFSIPGNQYTVSVSNS